MAKNDAKETKNVGISAQYLSLKKQLFDKYYSYLNNKQREAVFYVDGPLLVLAGAGTGKTKVLVERIAYILKYGNAYNSKSVPKNIDENKIEELSNELKNEKISEDILAQFSYRVPAPYSILAITFTNKAANEMKERLLSKIGDEANDIWAGTFHSMCLRILRSNAEKLQISKNFGIYDEQDTKKVIEDIMKDIIIKDSKITSNFVRSEISKAKDNLITPEEFDKNVSDNEPVMQIVSSIYTAYRNRLRANQALDFDDIIMYTVQLLRENEDVREHYQKKFRYVLIDEFQDTNYAQFTLAQLLSGGYGNLMVVGDDDQSIYKFRGATIENILHFEDKVEGAYEIKLEENYRSTNNILSAANSVISHNFGRRGKDLWTSRGDGDKIFLKQVEDAQEEAKFIQRVIIENVFKFKKKYSDFAILYRTNAQSRVLEEVFVKSGMPYRILSGHKFYDRKEVKDILAYLSVVSNPDDNFHLERIINEPKRKIGESTMETVRMISDYENKSYFYIISHTDSFPSIQKSKSKFEIFVNLIGELKIDSTEMSLTELIENVYVKSGYKTMLEAMEDEEGKERHNNILELISTAAEYEKNNDDPTLEGFLENVSLVSDIDNYDSEADAVVMMTIHSAKGLEFPIVFIPGMEEKLLPSYLNMETKEQIEEERRLAYVAITRAKEKCIMTFANMRMLFGKTEYCEQSRFVKELNEENVIYDLIKPKTRVVVDQYVARNRHVKISDELTSNTPNTIKNKTSGTFTPGDRVKHMMFGEGTIVSAKLMGADTLYEISFDKCGTKKLMATFAKLTKI